MHLLNGSSGEGGGQIVRTALSLAATLGQSVTLENIRAGRPKPGLRAQHLTGVKALAQVAQAEVAGAELGSRRLTFRPRTLRSGHFSFDVAEKTGSAGSVTLVAQTLIPVLLRAAGPSTVTIRGGTHVPWSPPVHYLLHIFLPALAEMGAHVTLSLERWGWYPRGGGEVSLTVAPAPALKPVNWQEPPPAAAFKALSAAANLPEHVVRRQAARLKERLGESLRVEEISIQSQDPGSLAFIWGPGAGFSALGARGKSAEKVADEAAEAYLRYRSRQAAVDRHLADQLLLYLAQASGTSTLVTEEVTSHLLTNLWVIEQFLGPRFQVRGSRGERGVLTCRGAG